MLQSQISTQRTKLLQDYHSFVSRILREENCAWPENGDNAFSDFFLRQTRQDGIQLLIHRAASQTLVWQHWPQPVRQTLDDTAKHDAIIDIFRQQDLTFLVQILRDNKVEPILLKGAALSYTHYPEPYLRTRTDTDILIPLHDAGRLEGLLKPHAYLSAGKIEGGLINHQQLYKHTSPQGPVFFYDIHHRLLNPRDFSGSLTYDEILREAREIPAGGDTLKIISDRHALLHACMHRVAHHYGDPKLLWLYDIHLLLAGKSDAWLQSFYEFAVEKKMAKICGESFRLSAQWFQMNLPEGWIEKLQNVPHYEPSEKYLHRQMNQISLFLRDFKAVGAVEKIRLVREHCFPSPAYMKAKYKVQSSWSLPFLYLWRILSGFPRLFRKLNTTAPSV